MSRKLSDPDVRLKRFVSSLEQEIRERQRGCRDVSARWALMTVAAAIQKAKREVGLF